MLSVILNVFRREFEGYAKAHRQPVQVHKAASAIRSCRTPQRGYHIVGCPDGHLQRQVNNSCHHRACALCAFMVVERGMRKQAGWHSLRELLADEKYLGALPGAIGSLHTWQQRLLPHVHAHFLVTAGGMSSDGRRLDPKKKHLLPIRVLQAKFRGKFRACLLKALSGGDLRLPPGMTVQQGVNLLNKLGRKKWNAEIRPRYEHGRGVTHYLARYVRGGPIAPKRIIAYDPAGVTIRLKRSGSERDAAVGGDRSVFRLSATEFLCRFITHVVPTGLHVVRSYGLFHHGKPVRQTACHTSGRSPRQTQPFTSTQGRRMRPPRDIQFRAPRPRSACFRPVRPSFGVASSSTTPLRNRACLRLPQSRPLPLAPHPCPVQKYIRLFGSKRVPGLCNQSLHQIRPAPPELVNS